MRTGCGLRLGYPARTGIGAGGGPTIDCLSMPVCGWRVACLWLARGATPWRDLPPEFGNWKSVYTRFRRWSRAGVFDNLFEALSADPDFEYVLIDATISKVHADATSQKAGLKLTPSGGREEA